MLMMIVMDTTRTDYHYLRKRNGEKHSQGAPFEDNSNSVNNRTTNNPLGWSEKVTTSKSKKKKTSKSMFVDAHQQQLTGQKSTDDKQTNEIKRVVAEKMLPKVIYHSGITSSSVGGGGRSTEDKVTIREMNKLDEQTNERPNLVTARRKRNDHGGGTIKNQLHSPSLSENTRRLELSSRPRQSIFRTNQQAAIGKQSSSSPSKLLFLEPVMPFNIKMPIKFLLLSLLSLLLISQQSALYLANAMSQNFDLLTIAPPFASTRNSAVAASMLQQQRQQPNNLNNHSAMLTSSNDRARRQQQQQQFEPIRMAGSSNKFTRTNELDSFLDDMNHNELRTIAAGKPIRDLFIPKPVNQAEQTPINNQQQQHSSGSLDHQKASQDQSTRNTGLMGSHSEQQVYSECALILQRTYVKNMDDSKLRLVPFGKTEQACISYKHIDKAIEQAKHKLKFREFAKMRKNPISTGPRRPPLAPLDVIHSTLEPPEDLIAAIGEINMATTQILADQFDLSNDELLNGLPLIDMSKTKFWPLCPLLVRQDIKCRVSRFRTFTAHCNNIKHPSWGAAMTPYARYLPPVHPDGIWIPRKSIVSEITFELGDGHHETHSNVAHPTMPHPIFDGSHNDEDESRHHHHSMVIDHRTDDGGGNAAAATNTVNSQDPSAIRDNELAVDSSVHFFRRTKLDQPDDQFKPMLAAANDHHQQQHLATSTEATTALAAAHYHQSHSPGNPHRQHVAAAESISMADHHHHHQLHHNQAIASAASVPHKSSSRHHHHKHHSVLQELPSARLVSSLVHRDVDQPNHDFSLTFMSWGQVINHDMTRAAQPPSSIKCCNNNRQSNGTTAMATKHKLCLPIQVPENDPFYSKYNVQCLEFRRSLAGVRPNCVLGPRVHQNAITHPIDASFVYGSSQAQADSLRLFKGGRLRDRDWFHREGLKPLLPPQDDEPDLECIARPKDLFCFLAGDVRANEQTHLTVLHTLYMREHNRLADKLSELNPHWDDERTYQEARHIVAAGIQHVLINEYVPLLIGRKMAELYNLTAQPVHHGIPVAARQAYWRGYDPSVTTSVSNSFAAAAFRQGHSFIQGTIERFNKFHEFVASEKLRFLFKQPFLLYQPGVIDELTLGMLDQPSQSHDPFISEDVSGHLFQPPELQFGHDLAAINIQRGRDQGLPGYNLWREWCGLPRAETFEQLEPYLTNHTAYHYSRLYKHVDDIDLWSGGVSERRLPGAAIGPTFACIIARQFSNTRRGDRFWYENPGLPSSFTPDQLGELRKVTLAKLLCANSDDLPTIQRWALRMAHPVLNPRVDCHQLPDMDLQFWQEE